MDNEKQSKIDIAEEIISTNNRLEEIYRFLGTNSNEENFSPLNPANSLQFRGRYKQRAHSEYPLSEQEFNILKLMAQGLSNKEIAESLYLSPKSIEHQLGTSDAARGIYSLIGVQNRVQAAVWFVKNFGFEEVE